MADGFRSWAADGKECHLPNHKFRPELFPERTSSYLDINSPFFPISNKCAPTIPRRAYEPNKVLNLWIA